MRWADKLKEYEYKIEYKKGSENQAADALSRVFPIRRDLPQDSLENIAIDLEEKLPDIEIFENPGERDLVTLEPNEQPPRIPTPEEMQILPPLVYAPDTEVEKTNEERKKLNDDYYRWFSQPTETREVEKPNANGKHWRQLIKRESATSSSVNMGSHHETKWLAAINSLALETLNRKLGILRLHFNDPTITSTARIKLKTVVAFIGHKYSQLKIHTCYRSTAELSEEEKKQIIRESHGSVMAQHFGENKSIARARELGTWTNMEEDIIKFVKSCDVYQTQKLTRIKRKAEGIIPDTTDGSK